MSIFSILKSDSFSSTLQSLSGKAMEVAGTVGKNIPQSVQDLGNRAKDAAGGARAKDAVGTVSNNLPKNTGTLLGVGSLVALLGAVLPKDVVKTAAVVGAGAIAWNFYKKWSTNKEQQAAEIPAAQEALPPAEDPAAMLMLRAMVYAARADGHIDAAEQERIGKLTQQFLPGRNSQAIVDELVREPLNLDLLASQMQSQEQREDLYRLSCLVLDIDHFMERGYLDALAGALAIDKERQAFLEKEAEDAKAQLDAM